ncbi:MAG TPA: maleylpyruvate isomerase family mycothiol-dependent enzyme [Actinomycetes bacterium]|nr:maleylpyruvate isomerase family mycothiol-dependent enzyme [Actinomycetes bacterium]
METKEYLAALRREGRVLGDAAERAGLQAPVPSCPGWTVADLVWHIGEVHRFWGGVVERRATNHAEVPTPDRPAPADLLAWYREGLERLAGVLVAADPATAVWTWAPQKDVAFVQRRMAQETAVHRVDAELAAGAPTPIDPTLAVDGVDEFFQFHTAWKREGAAPLGGSVHLHASDADGEWLVTETDDRLQVTRGHAKGSAAARGPAGDLLLLLWRRRGPSDVEVHGDAAALDRLLARTNLD